MPIVGTTCFVSPPISCETDSVNPGRVQSRSNTTSSCWRVTAITAPARVRAGVVAPRNQALHSLESAPVPDATLVWWRAQLRAHEDAGRKAARPIAMVQGVAIGIAGVAALSVGRTFWPWIREYWSGVAAAGANVAAATTVAANAAPWVTLAIAVSLVATPVAV